MTGKDKGNLDRILEGNAEPKKKVRRRVKKQPEKKGNSPEKTMKKTREKMSTGKFSGFDQYAYDVTDRKPTVNEIGPSKFRQKSADWMSDMEDGVQREHHEMHEGFQFKKWIKALTPVQWAAGFMAIVLFITSITGTVVYADYKSDQKLTEAFAQLETYEAMAAASEITSAELESVEVPLAMEEAPTQDETATKTLSLVLTSVEKDLKIKVVDGEDTLVKGIAWKVNVTDESDKTTELVDDDKDGVIHAKDMAAGDYSVALIPDDSITDYTFPSEPMMVAVKAKVEYKVIQDIRDEIKTEAEVNVAAEDTGGKQAADVETSTTLTDTVEFVESTKTPKGTTVDGYVESKVAYIGAAAVARGIMNFVALVVDTLRNSSKMQISPMYIISMPVGLLAVGLDGNTYPPKVDGATNLNVNQSTKLECSIDTASGLSISSVTWSGSNDAAEVSADGNVVAKAAGTVTCSGEVKYSNNTGETVTHNITINAVPEPTTYSFAITAPTGLKVNGGNGTMSYSGSGSNGVTITGVKYTSNNGCITIEGNTVKPISAGTATITGEATFSDGKTQTDSKDVTVAAADVEATIKISGASNIQVGKTVALKATVTPATDKVTWSSNAATIATVDTNTGVVTGKSVGSAKITATSTSGKTDEVNIVVTSASISVSKVEMKPTTLSLSLNGQGSVTATVTYSDGTTKNNTDIAWKSSNDTIATISNGTVTAKGVGEATITATSVSDTTKSATAKVTVSANYSDNDQLYDSAKNPLYILESSKYRLALYKDYKANKNQKFYKKSAVDEYLYTGWQTLNGLTYYFKKDNTKVTGEQVIGGVKYTFDNDGALSQGNGTLGIDVSKYQPSINWASVKASGISYVIIRCGYRGSSTGVLVEDPYFRSHIKGAKAAGLKVGVYFFTTAITEAEAVEEASMCAALCSGYGLNYPVFMDCESSNRAGYMSMSAAQRTSVIKAFCSTIRSAGYTPGVYANKTWLTSYMNASELSGYKIWLAQYNSQVTYKGRYDLWQFTSKGSVNGISGNVDMNQSYLGY